MHACNGAIGDIECVISRSGYTGEDGFEIAVAATVAERLARLLLAHGEVEAAGLGARDSLRLEAGFCLAGSDIDAGTTPVEAGLGWAVARKYRGEDPAPARFPGAAVVLRQLREGTRRTRVGLRPTGRALLRAGTALAAGTDVVGHVTSGTFGATVDGPIAMGYVERSHAAPGTVLSVTVRGHRHEVRVAALPFVPHRYPRP
jgi:aminomethyltransferase